MSKYRVAIVIDKGTIGKNCDTRDQVDQFILENNATRFRIRNNELGRVVETDAGIIIKEEKND